MLIEIGHFALIVALLVALLQGIAPLIGAGVGSRGMMTVARPAALLQFGLVALAFAIFMHAHVVSDFSVRNVFENSHIDKPMLYKVSGVWGSHEGSMLLWIFMLALFGALAAALSRSLPLRLSARALAIQGLLGFGMLAFVVATSNPFDRLFPAPVSGRDLNPLLQDPGLAFHPPFLYFGYVGFSITYSFAVAGVLEGRIDAAWARWVRPWALAAWCGLTIGIAMGSWWAYYILGWGGWWYWDPVENASFMPWLLGTALIHCIAVVEKRETLQRWALFLAIATFGMSLIGTFLVRSGVLTSVHSFAVDPGRGVFILALIVIVIGAALALYAWRAPTFGMGNGFAVVSREGSMLLNNLLVCAGMATVFLGTFYPLFAEIWSGAKLSVGPQYFTATFVPIMAPAIVAMTIGPVLAWRHGNLGAALRRLRVAIAGALLVPLVLLVAVPGTSWAAAAGVGLAVWAMLGVVVDIAGRVGFGKLAMISVWQRLRHMPGAAWGQSIAHFGMGVAVAGMTVTSAWRSERADIVHPGQTVEIAGYTLRFLGVEEADIANYRVNRGRVSVERPGAETFVLTPERRWFPVARSQTTNTAIVTNGLADLYLALGDPDGSGGWTLRAYYNPLVPWIWIGAVLAAFGGVVSLLDRRVKGRVAASRRASLMQPNAERA